MSCCGLSANHYGLVQTNRIASTRERIAISDDDDGNSILFMRDRAESCGPAIEICHSIAMGFDQRSSGAANAYRPRCNKAAKPRGRRFVDSADHYCPDNSFRRYFIDPISFRRYAERATEEVVRGSSAKSFACKSNSREIDISFSLSSSS
jgi:hypothetical protein